MTIRTVTRLAAPTVLALIVTISGMPQALAASRPSAPRSVTAKPGNTTVRVTWVPPLHDGGSPVTNYRVQRADAPTGPWANRVTLTATTFAWKDRGLTNGVTYYFRVRAHNATGWGAASGAVGATPRAVPSAPQSPTVTWGNQSATVSWSAPASDGGAAIDEYQLQYSTDDTTWSSLPAGLATQSTATGLTNGLLYYLRVRAHNVAGWGPASPEVLTTPGVPHTPTDLHAESRSNGVYVSWQSDWYTDNPPATSYEVQRSSDGVTWSDTYIYNNGPTAGLLDDTYTSGSLGQTYYFHVRGVNANGASPWSSTTSAVAGLAPSAVRNLAIQYIGQWSWNVVSWDAPLTGSPVQGYYVYRIVTEGAYQYVTTVAATDHPGYTDFGVTHTTDYWYRITPYNALGAGPSSEVHVTTS